MRKYAGDFDRARMREIAQNVRPGDLVNYELHHKDAYKTSFTRGLRGTIMGGLIGAYTGPQYHTAIVADVDKKSGDITFVESAIGRDTYVLPPKAVAKAARYTSFHFYRPNDASRAEGLRAARVAMAAAARKAQYPLADLPKVIARSVAEKAGRPFRSIVNKLDESSAQARKVGDEASLICSQLAAHAWGKAIGSERKFNRTLGVRAKEGSGIAVTPLTITQAAEKGRLQRIGVYHPKNLLSKEAAAPRDEVLLNEKDDYGHVRVVRSGSVVTLEDPPGKVQQSKIDLRDPDDLQFEYIRLLAEFVAATVPQRGNVCVLGVGGGTLPGWIARNRPDIQLTVVDIRALMFRVARNYFGMQLGEGSRELLEDASAFVKRAPAGSFDAIVVDIYFEGPSSLMRRPDFWYHVNRTLTPRGLALSNVWGGSPDEYNRITAAMKTAMGDSAAVSCRTTQQDVIVSRVRGSGSDAGKTARAVLDAAGLSNSVRG